MGIRVYSGVVQDVVGLIIVIIVVVVCVVGSGSLADDDALATGGAGLVLALGLGGALRGVGVAAAVAAAVELDAVAGAGDAVAFAGAAGRGRRDGRRGAGVAAAGAEGRDVGAGIGVGVAVVLGVFLGVVLDVGRGELGSELRDGGVGEVLASDLAGLGRALGLGRLDLGRGERATLLDERGLAAFLAGSLGRWGSGDWGRLGRWDVKGVELATGSGLGDGLAGWVVRDVVAVDDVVVPVALTLLEGLALEAEGTLPSTGLGGVLGERELAAVVVPGAEEVDGLAVGGSAEGEVKLDGCHFGSCIWLFVVLVRLIEQEELISSNAKSRPATIG